MSRDRKISGSFILSGAALVIVLILLQTTLFIQNSGVEQVRHSEYTAFSSTTTSAPGTTAILLHGWRCSASMMAPMARALVRAGIPAFTLELPGHGKSQKAFGIDCPAAGGICSPHSTNKIEVISAIKKLILDENLTNQKILLVGHSWGGSLGQEALQAADLSTYNLKLINLDGKLNSGTLPDDRIFSIFVENSQAYTEKSENILTKISHLGMISSDEIFQKIIQRIGGPGDSSPAGIWLPKAATLVILLLLFWSLHFFMPETQLVPAMETLKIKHVVFLFLIAAAVAGLFAFGLNSRIHNQFQIFTTARNAIFYYLMLSGLLFLIYLAGTGVFKVPKITWPAVRKNSGFVFLGFLPFPLIAFPFVDHYYYHTQLTGFRFPGFLLLTLAFLPLTISLAAFARTYLLRAVCWVSLFALFLLFYHPARVVSESGEGLLGILLLEIYVLRFEKQTGSWPAASGLMALIMGWLVTVMYPAFAAL